MALPVEPALLKGRKNVTVGLPPPGLGSTSPALDRRWGEPATVDEQLDGWMSLGVGVGTGSTV